MTMAVTFSRQSDTDARMSSICCQSFSSQNQKVSNIVSHSTYLKLYLIQARKHVGSTRDTYHSNLRNFLKAKEKQQDFAQLDTFNRNQIFKSRMGCSENKREQLIMFFHLHHSRKCYLVNMVYQYHHMTDGTRQSAEPVGNLSAADSLLPKRLQYLWFQKRSGYCDQRLQLLSDSGGAPCVELQLSSTKVLQTLSNLSLLPRQVRTVVQN